MTPTHVMVGIVCQRCEGRGTDEGFGRNLCSRCKGDGAEMRPMKIAEFVAFMAKAETHGIWCLEDRAWCCKGSEHAMRAELPRWQSGEAAAVDPAHFHYEVRETTR